MEVRAGSEADADAVAAIFNQGIEDGTATFETRPWTAGDAARAIRSDLVLVAEVEGEVVAWAKAGPYADRHHYYDGIREATLYVDHSARRRGIGAALLEVLAEAARDAGHHKLVGKIFTSNEASIALVRGLGWREVGVHRRHGVLDGEWRDVLVVERFLT